MVSNGLLEREIMSQKISGRWYSIVVTIWYVRSQSEDRVLNHLHGSWTAGRQENHGQATIPTQMIEHAA